MKWLALLFASLLLSGCTTLLPVTWEARMQKHSRLSTPKLHYQEQGRGDVLLLLHGFGESSFTWRYLVDDLAQRYRVINVDLKGFGRSPKPKDGRYSVYDQAQAVSKLIESLGLQRVTLVGHSLGGGVALALTLMAQRTPWQVERLVVIDAAAYQQNLPSMLRDLRKPVLGQVGVYLVSPHYQARKAYEYAFFDDRKIPPEGVRESARNFASPGARYVYLQTARQLIPDDIQQIARGYTTINVPTLIIWGYNDIIVPRRFGRRLHRDIPNSRLIWIYRAGHMPHEEQPAAVLKALWRFL